MTPDELVAARLSIQGVSDPRFDRPAAVVRWLGAVQAQDYLGGMWGIGLRGRAITEAAVERAIASRAIVRTWPMRGTLHFIAAADARWMLELLMPRVFAGNQRRLRAMGIDARVLSASRAVIIKALRDGGQLARDTLYELLDDAGIETGGGRGLHLVWAHAHERLICFGERQGKQQTFALLEEWVPDAKPLQRDEALATLAKRYYTSHGPATDRDFAWWAGLPLGEARRATDMAQPLDRVLHDGREYWWIEREVVPLDARMTLLPAWDEYTVSYADREALVDASHRRKLDRYGVMNPVIVQRGRAIGSWKRTLTNEQVRIKPRLFTRLPKVERKQLDQAVKRYGLFLGIPASFTTRL